MPSQCDTRPAPLFSLQSTRLNEIRGFLSGKPLSLGRTITDQQSWNQIIRKMETSPLLEKAQSLLAEPVPELPDELYLEFFRNGKRTGWQTALNAVMKEMTTLVLAECVDNRGRFLPRIEKLLLLFCDLKTWVLPAHDKNADDFNGRIITLDLVSSMIAWDLVTIRDILLPVLSESVSERIASEIERRIAGPYLKILNGEQSPMFWFSTKSNWNAVCVAGITGALLGTPRPPDEQAFFIAAAEKLIDTFIASFSSDGVCHEGMSYWSYGFGHFLMLAELLLRATSGRVNILSHEGVLKPSIYPFQSEIINGIYPAFADCPIFASPNPHYINYLRHHFDQLVTPQQQGWKLDDVTESIYRDCMFLFPPLPAKNFSAHSQDVQAGLYSWFPASAIYTGRPAHNTPNAIGVACKGGHNDELHNHNDLGSFVVVKGRRPLIVDPGTENYSARTFTDRRYECKLLSSFGHSVPVPGGLLQSPGAEHKATILEHTFSPEKDTLCMDLRGAYDLSSLTGLRRTFIYSRQDNCGLCVLDEATFSAPETFASTLITLGHLTKNAENEYILNDGDERLLLQIDTDGQPYTISEETIIEDSAYQPNRILIALNTPATSARIRFTFKGV